jgi:hypothetical protein
VFLLMYAVGVVVAISLVVVVEMRVLRMRRLHVVAGIIIVTLVMSVATILRTRSSVVQAKDRVVITEFFSRVYRRQ